MHELIDLAVNSIVGFKISYTHYFSALKHQVFMNVSRTSCTGSLID